MREAAARLEKCIECTFFKAGDLVFRTVRGYAPILHRLMRPYFKVSRNYMRRGGRLDSLFYKRPAVHLR